jgi:hypothetical protein
VTREIATSSPGSDAPAFGQATGDLQEALQRALRDLPARQREAVVLRHFVDLSVADTAAAMGCDPGDGKEPNKQRANGAARAVVTGGDATTGKATASCPLTTRYSNC